MSIDIARVDGGGFSAEARQEEAVLRVRLTGTADMESKADLEQVMEKVQVQARRLEVEKVIVDFQELEFMNSSCFKVFVTWLAQVQELEKDQQYRIHFLSNPELHWQRRSLAALRGFAFDLVTIET